ncbi:MAG: hypothetical protein HOK97_04615, partial [Deltaproteobacteria bacterium]|nr:hypothetical protein [Deltaproteobacteria bacterium]
VTPTPEPVAKPARVETPKPVAQAKAAPVAENKKPVVAAREPQVKADRTPKPRPKPKLKAMPGFGNLQISTIPPVPIQLNGRKVGQTFKLKNMKGTLTFGSGDDPQSNPFKVTMRYRVNDGEISYSVNSEPWAIVRGAQGIGLGRTPLDYQEPTKRAVFELLNPKKGLHQRITLRFISP